MTLKDEINHNSLINIIRGVCGFMAHNVWQEMRRENGLDMVAADISLSVARRKTLKDSDE